MHSSTCTVLFFLLINILLVSLLSIFVKILFLQSWRVRVLSLTPDRVAKIWCSWCSDMTSILNLWLRNWNLTSSCCRLRPPEISSTSISHQVMSSSLGQYFLLHPLFFILRFSQIYFYIICFNTYLFLWWTYFLYINCLNYTYSQWFLNSFCFLLLCLMEIHISITFGI